MVIILYHLTPIIKNDLVFGERPTKGINDSIGVTEKKITLVKQRQKFVWVCIAKVLIVICEYLRQMFINLRHIITYLGMSYI